MVSTMRVTRWAGLTLTTSTIVLAAATGAQAAASNPVVVQPGTVAAGGQVSIFDGGNCISPFTGVATFSGGGGSVIPPVALSLLNNQTGGTTTIPASTKPGTYGVQVVCTKAAGSNDIFEGSITITAATSSNTTPTGAAATGDGASITGTGGTATGVAAIGVALALAAGAAYRRRSVRER
jgi:hypothetical protein